MTINFEILVFFVHATDSNKWNRRQIDTMQLNKYQSMTTPEREHTQKILKNEYRSGKFFFQMTIKFEILVSFIQ